MLYNEFTRIVHDVLIGTGNKVQINHTHIHTRTVEHKNTNSLKTQGRLNGFAKYIALVVNRTHDERAHSNNRALNH